MNHLSDNTILEDNVCLFDTYNYVKNTLTHAQILQKKYFLSLSRRSNKKYMNGVLKGIKIPTDLTT